CRRNSLRWLWPRSIAECLTGGATQTITQRRKERLGLSCGGTARPRHATSAAKSSRPGSRRGCPTGTGTTTRVRAGGSPDRSAASQQAKGKDKDSHEPNALPEEGTKPVTASVTLWPSIMAQRYNPVAAGSPA